MFDRYSFVRASKGQIKIDELRNAMRIERNEELLYVADAAPSDRWFYEILITKIPVAYWADLWELRIETEDRIGVLSELTDLLAEKNISIVQMNGAIECDSYFQPMSFLLSCSRYQTTNDGTTDSRLRNRSDALPDLERELLINFLHVLRINGSDAPTLSIRPADRYRELHRDVSLLRRRYVQTSTSRNAATLSLPDELWDKVAERSADFELVYMVDRFWGIGKLLVPLPATALVSIELDVTASVTKTISAVLDELRQRQLNVVFSTLQPCVVRRRGAAKLNGPETRPSRLKLLVQGEFGSDIERLKSRVEFLQKPAWADRTLNVGYRICAQPRHASA